MGLHLVDNQFLFGGVDFSNELDVMTITLDAPVHDASRQGKTQRASRRGKVQVKINAKIDQDFAVAKLHATLTTAAAADPAVVAVVAKADNAAAVWTGDFTFGPYSPTGGTHGEPQTVTIELVGADDIVET